MKFITTIFLLFSIPALIFGQEPEIRPVPLDDSAVGFLGMVQDHNGYIWLADNGNGLYKFDGKNKIHYKPIEANTNSLASGRIENLIVDKDGILWLAHFEKGLDRFDPETETFTHYVHNKQDSTTIRSNDLRDVVEDSEGNLWIGSTLGVDKFDKKTGEFIHHFSEDPDAAILQEEHIRKIYIDKAGIIWIGTGSVFFTEQTTGGLFRLNPVTGEIDIYRNTDQENSLIDNRVRAIFEDSQGVLWIGTAGDGLHTMNKEDGTFTRHTYDPDKPNDLSRPPTKNIFGFGVDHITFIDEDNLGKIWIGTFGNGIVSYDHQSGLVEYFGPNEIGKNYARIPAYWDILKTSEGILWIASFTTIGGYELFKLNQATKRIKYEKLEGITGFNLDHKGNSFIALLDGVYSYVNEELQPIFKIEDFKENEFQLIQEFVFDADENIWTGTNGLGLFFYDRNKKQLKQFKHDPENKNSLSSNYTGSVTIRANGELFIGTSKGLDIFYPISDRFEHFELKNPSFSSSSDNSSKRVMVDGKDQIWIGGMGGIYRFDRANATFTKYELGRGHELIIDMLIDSDGVLWIGTSNHGLRKFNQDKDIFENIIDKAGYLNEYTTIRWMHQDLNKDMWINTFQKEIIKYNIHTNEGTRFEESWFIGDEQIYLRGVAQLANGDLMFGGPAGYWQFNPNDIKKNADDIRNPFIEKLIIGKKTLNPEYDFELYKSFRNESTIELPYDQNDISFKIGYIDFENETENQSLSYILENYDQDWRTTFSGNVENYYQLPPGNYNLILKAQDVYGNWGEKKLAIKITSPWYLTIWAYILYAFLFISAVILVHRFQKNRLLKKAQLLSKEKELEQAKKIKKAYEKLGIAHNNLKATQSLLIQSEKMASLGELTAGIAHEIQNPLNFVKNFSEVSTELIDEMIDDLKSGKQQEVIALAGEIKDNQERINHHGKRAGSIVRGMLMHSRSSSGEKVATDINALCDEYLRLSYHGLRAKDKSFNADLDTDLDNEIPNIEVVPQDFGRVLLNLINNAFYAVKEKSESGIEGFKPKVEVSTKLLKDKIEIKVTDNGNGIPQKVLDKIFQPFFTTKPTGQGTGLGLSLSYDIVTAHGGELKVETKEEVGTTFIIQLTTL